MDEKIVDLLLESAKLAREQKKLTFLFALKRELGTISLTIHVLIFREEFDNSSFKIKNPRLWEKIVDVLSEQLIAGESR